MKNVRLLFILYFFLLTACGFHLQGDLKLAKPLHRMYVQTPDPYGYLARNLKQDLKISKVLLVPSPEYADTILVILQDHISSNLLGVSGTNQTRQYKLITTVTFEITDTKGRIILSPQTLSESQVITVESNQVLGSSNLANTYYQQMRRSLANAIMMRIASKQVTKIVNQAFYE